MTRFRVSVISVLGLLLLTIILLCSACNSTPTATAPTTTAPITTASSEVITFRYSSPFKQTENPTIYADRMMDTIEKQSGGKIKFDRFYSGSLGTSAEQFGLVSGGSVDCATFIPSMFPKQFQLTQLINAPQMVSSREQAVKNVIEMMQGNAETKAILEKEWAKSNVKVLYMYQGGPSGITVRTLVKSLADLKGMKINSSTPIANAQFKSLGMTPINVQIPDVYESLSRGVIDCAFLSISGHLTNRWYESGKTYISITTYGSITPVTFNLKSWNRLTPALQKIVMDASQESAMWSNSYDQQIETDALATFKKAGETIFIPSFGELSGWIQATRDYWLNTWMNDCKAAGVEADAQVIWKYWDTLAWPKS